MLNKKTSTIAIIDSGIGGVSVLRQLIAKYNAGNYIYFADNLFMPYGNKSKSFVSKRINKIVDELNEKYKVDHIFIACNTASTCIDVTKFTNVTTMQFNKKHAYFTTKRTSLNLPHINAISDKTLANNIEKNIFKSEKLLKIVEKHALKHHLQKKNEIILGCTHYELVISLFEKLCPNTKFIKNSEFIVNNINFEFVSKDLNLIVLTSKKDSILEDKISKLTFNK